ncbi:hypothetical protein E2P81_ATG04162 [Venturia nashicola]|nr:hypothetical protein E2P81_ATG04162 [Venturia nashicola]
MDPDQMVQADGVYVVAECRLPLSPTTVCRHKASSTAAVTTFGAMINLENTMQEAPSKRKSCLPRQQHQRLARRINWPASLAGSIGPPRSQASIGPASLAVEAHQVRAAKTVPASIQIRSSQLFVACPPRRPSVPVGETMCVWLVGKADGSMAIYLPVRVHVTGVCKRNSSLGAENAERQRQSKLNGCMSASGAQHVGQWRPACRPQRPACRPVAPSMSATAPSMSATAPSMSAIAPSMSATAPSISVPSKLDSIQKIVGSRFTC